MSGAELGTGLFGRGNELQECRTHVFANGPLLGSQIVRSRNFGRWAGSRVLSFNRRRWDTANLGQPKDQTFAISKVGRANSSSTAGFLSIKPCSKAYCVSASISGMFSCTPYFQKSGPI